MTQKWLSKAQVCSALDVGERKLDALIAEGRFPKGVRVSANGRLRWPAKDVTAFLHLLGRLGNLEDSSEAKENGDE